MPVREKREFLIPPLLVGKGRPALEYIFMQKLDAILARLDAAHDLLSSLELALILETYPAWPGAAAREGRGPKPSSVGRLFVYRKEDVREWLHFLAKAHKANQRKQ